MTDYDPEYLHSLHDRTVSLSLINCQTASVDGSVYFGSSATLNLALPLPLLTVASTCQPHSACRCGLRCTSRCSKTDLTITVFFLTPEQIPDRFFRTHSRDATHNYMDNPIVK
ncbi:hypothetical protein J6590_098851, partial [Homalodisca vitripennis]